MFEEDHLKNWLVLPPEHWPTQTYYKVFKEYANQIVVTNDHCERAVGMMQKFIHRYSDEEEKQKRLLTVDAARYAMKRREAKSPQNNPKNI